MQAYIVQGLMLLYMKAHQKAQGFTQTQINTYPIMTHAVGIIAEAASAIAIDQYNMRLSVGFALCIIQVACAVVLLIPHIPLAGHIAALYLSSISYGINPLLYSWSSNIVSLTADDAARSVILASMAASDGLLWTFWGIALYPADDAPYWKTGYITMICVCAALCSWLFLVRWVCDAAVVREPIVELTIDRWIATPQGSTPSPPFRLSPAQGLRRPINQQKRSECKENADLAARTISPTVPLKRIVFLIGRQ